MEVDAQPRTAGPQEAHQTRQDRRARAREHADANDGRAARERVELRDRRRQVAEHRRRVPGDDRTGGRQVGTTLAAPVDQDRAEPLLELRDLVRDRGLGQVQRLRRAAERPVLGDRLQRREVPQVDTVPAQCRLPESVGLRAMSGKAANVAERRMPPDHRGYDRPVSRPPTACRSRRRVHSPAVDRDRVATARIEAARDAMAAEGLDALLLASGTNLCFLSGYPVGRAHARAAVLPPAPAHAARRADRPHGTRVRGPVAVVGPRRPHLRPPLGRTGRGAGRGRARRRPRRRAHRRGARVRAAPRDPGARARAHRGGAGAGHDRRCLRAAVGPSRPQGAVGRRGDAPGVRLHGRGVRADVLGRPRGIDRARGRPHHADRDRPRRVAARPGWRSRRGPAGTTS